jgi:hypothetical protein
VVYNIEEALSVVVIDTLAAAVALTGKPANEDNAVKRQHRNMDANSFLKGIQISDIKTTGFTKLLSDMLKCK